LLISSSSTAGGTKAARAPRPQPQGTSSTPGAFTLPGLGTVGFRCNSAFAVQPTFNTSDSPTEDTITMRAGRVVVRNYRKVVVHEHGHRLTEIRFAPMGSSLALPFGHYRTVVVSAHEATEARAITGTLQVTFMAGRFRDSPRGPLLGACFAVRWKAVVNISPF
jgi:hypothetical protein